MFNDDSEWDIFQNIINIDSKLFARHKNERELLEKVKSANWSDNTNTRPDFISEDMMIEMFEIDDIITTKKGKNNPQRKADARAMRDVQKFIDEVGGFREGIKVIARGDTRYNSETDSYDYERGDEHHSYQAYINNFQRICQKHLESVPDYRKNYPDKQLGFLIVDDATFYASKLQMLPREVFGSLPFFDKNFMKLFVKSDVDFVIWAFNNKYLYTDKDHHGQNSFIPEVTLVMKDYYYNRFTKFFDIDKMKSLEE